MADKKITDLANKATAAASDIVPIVDPADNTTKRTTVGGLIGALLSVIPDGSLITAMFGNASVTAQKIDFSSFARPQVSRNANSGTTTSTSFTSTLSGLSGGTPSVTVVVPASGEVMLNMFARMSNSAADQLCVVGFAASGANTISASESDAMYRRGPTNLDTRSRSIMLTGLTPGSTTFSLQYRVAGSTGTFANIELSVVPLP